jgi:hypothetical protein
VQHRFVTAGFHLFPDRGEPFVIILARVAHLQHKKSVGPRGKPELLTPHIEFVERHRERHPLSREHFGRVMVGLGAKAKRLSNAPIGEHIADVEMSHSVVRDDRAKNRKEFCREGNAATAQPGAASTTTWRLRCQIISPYFDNPDNPDKAQKAGHPTRQGCQGKGCHPDATGVGEDQRGSSRTGAPPLPLFPDRSIAVPSGW